jgi:hypothetical protein
MQGPVYARHVLEPLPNIVPPEPVVQYGGSIAETPINLV